MKDIDTAVHAARLYIGSDATARVADQQKLYRAMMTRIASVAKKRNMDEQSAYDQIIAHARGLGGITPRPGKDI